MKKPGTRGTVVRVPLRTGIGSDICRGPFRWTVEDIESLSPRTSDLRIFPATTSSRWMLNLDRLHSWRNHGKTFTASISSSGFQYSTWAASSLSRFAVCTARNFWDDQMRRSGTYNSKQLSFFKKTLTEPNRVNSTGWILRRKSKSWETFSFSK